MQKEILANIKQKKELAQSAIATGSFEVANRMHLNQLTVN